MAECMHDYPPSEDAAYIERVLLPLYCGFGVAAFFAWDADGEPNAVTAAYRPGLGAAIDPVERNRAVELVAKQGVARELAATHGQEAMVP